MKVGRHGTNCKDFPSASLVLTPTKLNRLELMLGLEVLPRGEKAESTTSRDPMVIRQPGAFIFSALVCLSLLDLHETGLEKVSVNEEPPVIRSANSKILSKSWTSAFSVSE